MTKKLTRSVEMRTRHLYVFSWLMASFRSLWSWLPAIQAVGQPWLIKTSAIFCALKYDKVKNYKVTAWSRYNFYFQRKVYTIMIFSKLIYMTNLTIMDCAIFFSSLINLISEKKILFFFFTLNKIMEENVSLWIRITYVKFLPGLEVGKDKTLLEIDRWQ